LRSYDLHRSGRGIAKPHRSGPTGNQHAKKAIPMPPSSSLTHQFHLKTNGASIDKKLPSSGRSLGRFSFFASPPSPISASGFAEKVRAEVSRFLTASNLLLGMAASVRRLPSGAPQRARNSNPYFGQKGSNPYRRRKKKIYLSECSGCHGRISKPGKGGSGPGCSDSPPRLSSLGVDSELNGKRPKFSGRLARVFNPPLPRACL